MKRIVLATILIFGTGFVGACTGLTIGVFVSMGTADSLNWTMYIALGFVLGAIVGALNVIQDSNSLSV